jgi:hypothetical protein
MELPVCACLQALVYLISTYVAGGLCRSPTNIMGERAGNDSFSKTRPFPTATAGLSTSTGMSPVGNLDETTLSTLNLLESRLLRIEQLLHGQTATPTPIQDDAATVRIRALEKRFSMLHSNVRVYSELLKICKMEAHHCQGALPVLYNLDS